MAHLTLGANPWVSAAQSTQGIPEEQRVKIWRQWQAEAVPFIPRSMSCMSQAMLHQDASLEPPPMNRHSESAPPTISMSRGKSLYATSNVQLSKQARRPASTPFTQNAPVAAEDWQTSNGESFYSISAKGPTCNPNWAFSLSQVTEVDTTDEDPESYLARQNLNHAIASHTTVNRELDASPSSPHDNNMLAVSTNFSWSSSPEHSPYPNSPSSCRSTSVSAPTSNLSRESSIGNSVMGQLGLMRIDSFHPQASHLVLPEETFLLGSSTLSSTNDSPQCVSVLADDGFTSSVSFPAQSFVSQEAVGVDPACMQRHNSNDSVSSNRSASSAASSRSQRVHQEQLARSAKRLAPKTESSTEDTSSTTAQASVASEHKSLNPKTRISRVSIVKHTNPKLNCPNCQESPDGYRGEHELRRHMERAHPQGPTKKGWITVDASDDGKFLANCKACQSGKLYWAYYNAAAHLRRTHFHPRKRGRRSKNDEKRGGKGGGDHPDMAYLKQSWLKEVEVQVGVKTLNANDSLALSDNDTKSPDALMQGQTFASSDEDTEVDSQIGERTDTQVTMPIDPNLENTDMNSFFSLEEMMMFPQGNNIEHSQEYILDDPNLFSFSTQDMLQMHCNDSSANAAFSEYSLTCSSSFSTAI